MPDQHSLLPGRLPGRVSGRTLRLGAAATAMAALTLSACTGMDGSSGSSANGDAGADCEEMTPVRVVLQWVTQAQFAGYYQALDQGYYAERCLEVTIQEGGTNVVPQQVLASGNAEFAVTHLTKTMASREQGADVVHIGQVFQRGAYLQVSMADSGIETIEDLRGTRMGSWGNGNELVQYAAIRAAGLEPGEDIDVVQQPFDMSILLDGEVDSAQAKTYNEYPQLLETENPETGELYQPEDFNVINLQDEGFSSLEDGIYARGEWLEEGDNEDVATRFLAASYEGWISCREQFDSCVNSVLSHGSALGEGHQRFMLNEVNKLIWPSPSGIGTVDRQAWNQTIVNAIDGGALEDTPDASARRSDLTATALEELREKGLDIFGRDFEPRNVRVTPGGR